MNVSEEKNLVERNIIEIVQFSVKFTSFCIKKTNLCSCDFIRRKRNSIYKAGRIQDKSLFCETRTVQKYYLNNLLSVPWNEKKVLKCSKLKKEGKIIDKKFSKYFIKILFSWILWKENDGKKLHV